MYNGPHLGYQFVLTDQMDPLTFYFPHEKKFIMVYMTKIKLEFKAYSNHFSYPNFKSVKDLGINKSFKVTSKTLFI